jgi:hypothetical protein
VRFRQPQKHTASDCRVYFTAHSINLACSRRHRININFLQRAITRSVAGSVHVAAKHVVATIEKKSGLPQPIQPCQQRQILHVIYYRFNIYFLRSQQHGLISSHHRSALAHHHHQHQHERIMAGVLRFKYYVPTSDITHSLTIFDVSSIHPSLSLSLSAHSLLMMSKWT